MYPLLRLLVILFVALFFAERGSLSGVESGVAVELANRTWQGIPGIERTAKGRVFVCWLLGLLVGGLVGWVGLG